MKKNCKQCGKEFYKSKSCSLKKWITQSKFCSFKCYWEAMNGVEITEKQKLKISKTMKDRGISPVVKWKKGIKSPCVMIGENHPNWKGGITTENNKLRNNLDYKFWHKAVLARDLFVCQKYGVGSGKLVVHHINNFSEFPELRYAIDNGITLSEKAHKEFHIIYGNKHNSKAQLEKFLS